MSLPTTGYYGTVTPVDVIQPIHKVLRLCGALVTAQTGDAVYPPAATTTNNDERGLGRLVVKQENMPYIDSVAAGAEQSLDLDASQQIAEKAIRSGIKFKNTAAAGVTFSLPEVDKFLAMGCKLGDRGSFRLTAELNPAGTAVPIFIGASAAARVYGARYYTTAEANVTNYCGWVIDWKIEDADGTAVPRIEYVIAGGVMTLVP